MRGSARALAVLAAGALCLSSVPGRAEGPPASTLIEQARAALRRGDGIDAEAKLRDAAAKGAPRDEIAAFMGEAYLDQGDSRQARRWLGPGQFSTSTAKEGFAALGRLELRDGNLPASGRAYDKALAIDADDAELWVEIGRLRYSGGEHVLAIDAADHALRLDPSNVAALQFGGQLVRDRYGLAAAVPWFERALMIDPKNVSVLLDYAATLGDLGRASESLIVTRRVLELSPKNPRAYYLQAVMAARAGKYALARGLMARTKGQLDDLPGAILLNGLVELAAGNSQAAEDLFERLLDVQPDNGRARDLLARAIVQAGQYRYATLRFADDIAHDRASPYVLTTVARAFERLGNREEAGRLLDLAARPDTSMLHVLPDGSAIGEMLAKGETPKAAAKAEADREAEPGTYDTLSLAGDALLALGHPAEAQQRYAAAAQIRMPESLFQRRFQAYVLANDMAGARGLVAGYLIQNPTSRPALRCAAILAYRGGDPARASAILAYLRDTGGDRDVQLLSDLALVQAQSGDVAGAQVSAETAYRLQRASPVATQALALSYVAAGVMPDAARALIAKARAMVGDNPMLVEAREQLALEQTKRG